jgi:hypothetical protein
VREYDAFVAQLDGRRSVVPAEENKAVIRRLVKEVYNEANLDVLDELMAAEAERATGACREDLETFAESVYEAADHGSAGLAATEA